MYSDMTEADQAEFRHSISHPPVVLASSAKHVDAMDAMDATELRAFEDAIGVRVDHSELVRRRRVEIARRNAK